MLVAVGAGIAVMTGIGAGIGIGLATSKAAEAMMHPLSIGSSAEFLPSQI